jgi:hypothetical protein
VKLCINCNNYDDEGIPVVCKAGHWMSIEQVKTKIYNPAMFECFDYETNEKSPGFGDDTFFGIFSGIMK